MKKIIYPITAMLVATSLLMTGCDNHVQTEALAIQKEPTDEVDTLYDIEEETVEEKTQKEEEITTSSLADYEYKAGDLWVVKIYNPLTEAEEYYIMTRGGYSYELDDERAKEVKESLSETIELKDEEIQLDKGSYYSIDIYTSIFNENIEVRETTTMICCWNEVTLCELSKNLFIGEEFSGHYERVFAAGVKPVKNFINNYYKDAKGVHTTESMCVIEQTLLYDYYGCRYDQIFYLDELEAMERDLNDSNIFTPSR